jgi:hypothetical protein
MKTELTAGERMVRRLSLRVGLERYLAASKTGFRWLPQTRHTFCGVTDEEFDGVLAEMELEGLIVRSAGKLGSVRLSLVGTTITEEENEQ